MNYYGKWNVLLYLIYLLLYSILSTYNTISIQKRRNKALASSEIVLWRMNHYFKLLPNSDGERFKTFRKWCATDPYQPCRYISALQNPFQPWRLIRVWKVSCIAYAKTLYLLFITKYAINNENCVLYPKIS